MDCYSAAAKALDPPREALNWDDAIEYTFVSQFDLLQDTRDNIHKKPWTSSAV